MKLLFEKFEELDVGRCIIRKINYSDYEDIFNIYGDIEVMKYDTKNILQSIDEAKENIKIINKAIENKWFIRLAIVDKHTSEVIGTIALHHFEFDKKKVQIGYNLKKTYWKQGIMTEVLNKFIRYLESNTSIKEIEASINTDNLASIKLAEKLGFKLYKQLDDNTKILKIIL